MCSIFVDNTGSSEKGGTCGGDCVFGLESAAFKMVLWAHGRKSEGEMAR